MLTWDYWHPFQYNFIGSIWDMLAKSSFNIRSDIHFVEKITQSFNGFNLFLVHLYLVCMQNTLRWSTFHLWRVSTFQVISCLLVDCMGLDCVQHWKDFWVPLQDKNHHSRYKDSHYKDKMVMRRSYLYNRNPFTGKIAFLYDFGNACRHCSNYIFILDLTPGFNGLNRDNSKMRRESFKFWDLVQLILDILRYTM